MSTPPRIPSSPGIRPVPDSNTSNSKETQGEKPSNPPPQMPGSLQGLTRPRPRDASTSFDGDAPIKAVPPARLRVPLKTDGVLIKPLPSLPEEAALPQEQAAHDGRVSTSLPPLPWGNDAVASNDETPDAPPATPEVRAASASTQTERVSTASASTQTEPASIPSAPAPTQHVTPRPATLAGNRNGESIELQDLAPGSTRVESNTNLAPSANVKPTESTRAITGELIPQPGGLWTSRNPALNSLLKYARAQGVRIGNGPRDGVPVTLSAAPPADIDAKLDTFKKACTIAQARLKNDESIELGTDVAIVALQRAMTEGRDAFGSSARMPTPGETGQPPQHPYDFLRSIGTSIKSNDPALQRALEERFAADPDLAGRLGAAWLLQAATAKPFDKASRTFTLANAAIAGSVAGLVDLTGTPELKKKALGSAVAWPSPTLTPSTKAAATFIDAISPTAADFVISITVQLASGAFKDAPLAQAWKKLGEPAKAAIASGLSSLPNSALHYADLNNPVAWHVLNALTSLFQAFGSMAIFPLEMHEGETHLNAAVIESMHNGFLAPPPSGQNAEKFVRESTANALVASPTYGVAQRALAAGIPIAMVHTIAAAALNSDVKEIDGVRDKLLTTIRSLAYNTAEWSGDQGVRLLARQVGIEDWSTTDARKAEQRFSLVLDSATRRSTGNDAAITSRELRAIDEPRGERLTAGTGRVVSSITNAFFQAPRKVASALGFAKPAESELLDFGSVKPQGDEQV